MIYLGDVAHPFRFPPEWSLCSRLWQQQWVCMNFEGAFFDSLDVPKKGVGNHLSISALIRDMNIVAFAANNHIFDDPESGAHTLRILEDLNAKILGAGRSREIAEAVVIVPEGPQEIVLIGLGWRTIGCRSRPRSQLFVNELCGRRALAQVARTRQLYPAAVIHVVVHWNYELELYPQPGHRILARELIMAGADAVIGHHPHLVGGVEWVSGKPIFYSLGNWWFPQGVFEHGTMRFPEESLMELAVEISPEGSAIAHWHRYDPTEHKLSHVVSEPARESGRLDALTPFRGMSDASYLKWFRGNRLKRKMLPIVTAHASPSVDMLVEAFVRVRHQCLVVVESLGLRRRRGMSLSSRNCRPTSLD